MENSEIVTWRTLELEGCGYGRLTEQKVCSMEKDVSDFRKRMDRLTWALVGTAITFGTAALMLALNLLV